MGVARILKEANADLTIKDKDGYTAINLTKGGEICELLHQVHLYKQLYDEYTQACVVYS